MVVPARDRDRWIERLRLYATEHDIDVGVVLTVGEDQAAAGHAMLAMLNSGEVDSILVAIHEHLPDLWPVIVASDPPRPRRIQRPNAHIVASEPPPTQNRPRVIDRGDPDVPYPERRPARVSRQQPANHPWRSR